MNRKTTIIPIASGKGGVGKSMLTANLAIALAELGHSTVAADLDLGGSNLHTMLGLPNKYPGIGDYLKGNQPSLQTLVVPTSYANLRFLPGDGRTPFMADIPFGQRLTLMKELSRIETRYLLLDLGAGSSFNTLNLFGMSRQGAIVTTFDTPAIMNFLMFLRNFQFRLITSLVKPHSQKLFDRLVNTFRQTMASEPLTVKRLLQLIAEQDRGLAVRIQKTSSEFEPRIIFNMGDRPEDLLIWQKLRNTMKQKFSMEAACFGFIFHDEFVRRSLRQNKILIKHHPDSPAGLCIADLARRVSERWDQPAGSFSEKRLMEETRNTKEKLKMRSADI
jgi:flagellar biosynthesis protein FlhG